VVADAAYHGPALKQLPASVTWTTRLPANAALSALAPPRLPGERGRPCLKGLRLGTPAELAAAATWTPVTVRIYGRSHRTDLAARTCLWYGCLHTRTVKVILARNHAGVLALVTTDLATPAAAALIERYAARWSIEVGHPWHRSSCAGFSWLRSLLAVGFLFGRCPAGAGVEAGGAGSALA